MSPIFTKFRILQRYMQERWFD